MDDGRLRAADTTPRDWLRGPAGGCALILVAGLALFGRALRFDFVRYDDWEFLAQYSAYISNFSYILSSFWRDAFSILGPEAQGVFYRPILILSYGVEAQLMGANPLIYHATNLVLHLVVSCLVYTLLHAFGSRRRLALGLALVFLAHPCAVLVATWIPARNDSLLAIWFCVGTLCVLRFMRGGRRAALVWSVLCYAGALFTKESGGVLLGILGLTALLELPGRPSRLRPLLAGAAAMVAVTLAWAALRAVALGGSPVGASNVLANATLPLVYLGKTLFPVDLAVVPHPADTSLLPGIAALAVLLGALALAWRRLLGPAGLGLVWYAAALAPAMLVPEQTWGLEHRIYLPSIGLLLFAAWLPAPGWLPAAARVGPTLAFSVAMVFAVLSWNRLPDYASPIAYWESAVASAPSSPLATSRIAWRYFEARRFPEMQLAIDAALEVNPDDGGLYLLRGIEAGNRRDLPVAQRNFERAVELSPDNPVAWENLARLQRSMGKKEQSRASQQRADELRGLAGLAR